MHCWRTPGFWDGLSWRALSPLCQLQSLLHCSPAAALAGCHGPMSQPELHQRYLLVQRDGLHYAARHHSTPEDPPCTTPFPGELPVLVTWLTAALQDFSVEPSPESPSMAKKCLPAGALLRTAAAASAASSAMHGAAALQAVLTRPDATLCSLFASVMGGRTDSADAAGAAGSHFEGPDLPARRHACHSNTRKHAQKLGLQ